MNQSIQELSKKERREDVGQITRINGLTITELEARITDILERTIVLEDAVKRYKIQQGEQ